MPLLPKKLLYIALLLWSCVPQKKLSLKPPIAREVPYTVAISTLTDNPGGRWFFNGTEVFPDGEGNLLVSQSGSYILDYRYYKDGEVLTTQTSFEALPPKDFCFLEILTPVGSMIAQLSPLAPEHADYFEYLVQHHYYDSLIFHRIVPGFVVQGGDAQETPFERKSEMVMRDEMEPEFHEDLLHYKGALAMARMPDQINQDKRSSPDQFYIVQGTSFDEERWTQFLTEQGTVYKSYQKDRYLERGGAPQLDGEYTIFGYLTHGYDVLDTLAMVPTKMDKPIEPIWMIIKKVE